MKKYLFSVAVACICLLPCRLYASGIPVVDAAAIAQDAANFAKEMLEMANQLNTLKSQLDQQLKQYESMTGDRGMGQLLDGQVRNYLPENWQSVMDILDTPSGYSGISSNIQRYIDENKIISDQDMQSMPQKTQILLEKKRKLYALNKSMSVEVYNKSSERVALLQQLTDKIGSSTDQKAILDLQARIQSEQTQLANEAAKLQALSQQLVNEDRNFRLQSQEYLINSGGRTDNMPNIQF